MRKPQITNQNIALSVPQIIGNEWKYIKECLDTNWVSSVGSFVDRFEQMVAGYVGTDYSVATINGTSALHVALLVAGVKPDDEVLIPTLTFVAPANAIRYCGAWPVFMDIDRESWQMSPEKTIDFLDSECYWRDGCLINKSTRRRIRSILPVHLLGHPCDMDPIREVAHKYGLTVIEDASESLGAKYNSSMVGCLGDIACFSFNGNKTITTGGGGMIVTDNVEWADQSRYLTTQAKDDPIEYVHNEIGYNYRLSNLQAAMGVAQLEQIDNFLDAKRDISVRYNEAFKDLPGIKLKQDQQDTEPTQWIYTVLLPEGTTIEDRKELIGALNQKGIGSRPLWHPIHGLPPYAECQGYQIENAFDVYNRAVSLPSSVGLTVDDQQKCIDAFKQLVLTGRSG